MGKTSPLTGTGKKAQKAIYKAQKFQAQQAVKEAKYNYPLKKGAAHAIKQVQKGRHIPEYKGKAKYKGEAKYEPHKFKGEAKYNAAKFKPETEYNRKSLSDLTTDFERAGRGAQRIYDPIKKQALADFHQNTLPGVNNALGSNSKSSSALNQAVAAAGGNLQRSLASDFAGLQTNVAQNLLGERESQRKFGAEFGNQQEQFGAGLREKQAEFGSTFKGKQEKFGANLRNLQDQYKAQFGNQQEQFGSNFGAQQELNKYNAGIQGLQARMQANQLLLGQPAQLQFNQLQGSYNQKMQKGPGALEAGIGGLAQGAGAAGVAAAVASSKEIKENIRDYEKGLDVIRDLDVKQYDYKIPVEGRSKDRVGLIAEDVPEEIQAMIGEIKAVDVYGLVALLVNCVKQLDMKVKSLEAKNA